MTDLQVLNNWERVLDVLYRCNLRLSASKTIINPQSTTVLGWIWSTGPLKASPHHIAMLASPPAPKTVKTRCWCRDPPIRLCHPQCPHAPLDLLGYEVIIANSALHTSMTIYHLISSAHLCNNYQLFTEVEVEIIVHKTEHKRWFYSYVTHLFLQWLRAQKPCEMPGGE